MAYEGAQATRSGAVTKQVRCEKCAGLYQYLMNRTVTARGVSGGGLLGALIAAFANNNLDGVAQKGLERRLAKECEPCPCPTCGWYQKEMVVLARRRKRTGLLSLGVTLASLGAIGLIGTLVIPAASLDPGATASIPALLITGGVLATGAALVFLRMSLNAKYDVNAGYPTPRPPIPGSARGAKVVEKPVEETSEELVLPDLQPD